jgi:hypothetical protein
MGAWVVASDPAGVDPLQRALRIKAFILFKRGRGSGKV